MSTLLDEAYLTWLYRQVGSVKLKNPQRTHWSLLRQLYKKEFVWFIPHDDNRAADGRALRYEFIGPDDIDAVDPAWLDLPCSMLEMLLALSRRLSFEGEGESREWFWILIGHLDISYNDREYNDKIEEDIDEALDQLIWRRYHPSGAGGLFPLEHEAQDQRDVEIWYQLNAYLLERI